MNDFRSIKALLPAALTAGTLGLAADAFGQQSADTGMQAIDEIVVMARKRSENLQEIPDSVTVFGEVAIERAGIGNISDFAALTPNLSAYGNFRPNLTNISIRGFTSTQLGEPPVAFVVDGITVPNLEFMNQGLVDIQQIEVIRGPQGALYGKNAIGGAINITTKAPSDETEFAVRGALGEGGDTRLSASVSGSLAENVIYRIAGFYRNFDGLIEDSFIGEASDFVDESGVQGLLGFQLTDRTYVDFRARYSTGDYGLGYYENVDFHTLSDESVTPAHNVPPNDENTLTNFSAKLEHEADAGSWIVVAGYNKSEDENFLDSDFSALPPDYDNFFFTGGQYSLIEDSTVTLEARFTSPSDRAFRWLAGAYYQDRERINDFDIYDDPIGTVIRDRASLAGEFLSEIVRDRQESTAFAVFGQANYDLTDLLELTLALRYDEEERQGEDPRDPGSFAQRTFDQLQPKVSLAWQATERLLTYATLARGFRSGGFNEVAPTVTRTFEAETSDTLEIGFKSTVVEGLLSLNAAYFITKQDNAQFTRFNPDTFSLEQLSIAEVDISGFELESWWTPTESIDVQLGLGVIDNEIKSFNREDFIFPPEGIVGNTMPRVADWNASLSVTYTTPLNGGLEFVTRVSGNWLGERNFDLENSLVDGGAAYLSLSVGLEADAWTLQLRGTNLTDRLEPEDAFLGIASPIARFRNEPRQLIAELMYRF
ncbi:MAG: TonB-dependent receptor [Gammaproteobacteria bacterium]|nr:TonB-dependent receptor [Chromatiales bacterium]MYE49434.1 TonB-dependent receptor [Gammaproteobacteria bacterium]